MNNMLQRAPARLKPATAFTHEERTQLNAILDLLIPADENFPPPSSLHLIDEFLHHLLPAARYTTMLNEKKLRSVLRDLDSAAGGSFCRANKEEQQMLLKRLEQRDPAFFQELWALANHSYYTRMATR
jgi:hypothetical protein